MMNKDELLSQWNKVYETILTYESVDFSQASAFLARLQPQAMSPGFIMLTADNDFIKNWIEKHYVNLIKQALLDIDGLDYTVALEVDESQSVPAAAPAAAPGAGASAAAGAAAGAGDAAPGAARAGAAGATTGAEATTEATGATPTTPAVAGSAGGPAGTPAISTPANDQYNSQASAHQTPQDTASLATTGAAAGMNSSEFPRHGEEMEQHSLSASTSSLTFENFVIGASNHMAYSMAVAVAENPGRQMLNPLFIYGKSGLGKTHLMRAIQNFVAETQPQLRTVYVDSADFLNGFVEASVAHDKEKASFNNFKSTYQEADILLIDDIQYLQGKEQTLDIVFQIFNHMIDLGKQVVLSADRAPKSITMDERYRSRFNSGGTFDIQPPEVETKLGIIKSFVEEYASTSSQPNFTLPKDVERYIAENSSSNIRELKSAVTKVIYAMNAFGKDDISIEDVSRLLENHFSGGAMKKLSITDIQKQVEQYYDIPHSDLIGQKRARKIAHARQVAIFLTREMLDLPYNYIGKSFGGRDHTTIMYSVSNIENKLRINRELAEELENIRRRIKDM